MSRSIIVTCAVTGSIHTPSQSPYLPLTPAQIIEESVAAAEAGAAVLHLHARNPADGSPTADPEIFMQFLPQIRARCDAIINITTGGGPGMSLEERLAAPELISPEMTSLNLGTMNFAGFMALEKLPKLEHEWERGYKEIARRHVFRNTFEDIDTVMLRLGEGHGVRFEMADAYALPPSLGRFDAALAVFWWSHVPRRRIGAFLGSLHARLERGARVLFMDNRYVEGSSTPIHERDADGNAFQIRRLADGSENRVMKNFPAGAELRADLAPFAASFSYRELPYYWVVEYELK